MRILSISSLSFVVAFLFIILATTVFVTTQPVEAAAGTCTWTGGAAANNFNDADNWSGCDADGVPENGDTLVFPTSVDSDTTDGDDRELTNDIADLSIAGLEVTGTYAEGDYDAYSISGNDLTLTGDVIGYTGNWTLLDLDLDLTAADDIIIDNVYSQGDLAAGNNDVELLDSTFEGGLSGSGTLTLDTNDSGGGAGGGCSPTALSGPFRGNSSGFTGAIVVNDSGLAINKSSGSLGRNASSITINSEGRLFFGLDQGQNLSFSGVPITLNGGIIYATQYYCDGSATVKTVTISSTITVNDPSEVYLSNTNLKLTGTVNGASKLKLQDGIDKDFKLIIGSTTKTSDTLVTTYTKSDGSDWPYAGANQIAIIAKGAITNEASVYGGILKGIGTVDGIYMLSGTVAPGTSPGCLTSTDGIVFDGGVLQIELAGEKACSHYDQLVVEGEVDLGEETTLDVRFLDDYFPKKGDVFTILKNDGSDAIAGTFDGLAEGDTYSNDDANFRISYKGDSGNDITLTVLNVPGAPDTGAPLLEVNTALPIASTVAVVGGLLVAKRQFAPSKIK